MLRTATLTATLCLAAAAPALLAPEHAPAKLHDIDWRTDLEAARAEARAAKKPLLVTFR